MWNKSWKVTERLIKKMQNIAETHSAEFLLLVIPSKEQVDEVYRQEIKEIYPKIDLNINKPNLQIAKFAKIEDIFPLCHPSSSVSPKVYQ